MSGVYVSYILISLTITVWVSRTLSFHGRPFLIQVFHRNSELADAVNQFLVVGFCLMNASFIFLTMQERQAVSALDDGIELLGLKVGRTILVLGITHFVNLFVFCYIRDRTRMGQI